MTNYLFNEGKNKIVGLSKGDSNSVRLLGVGNLNNLIGSFANKSTFANGSLVALSETLPYKLIDYRKVIFIGSMHIRLINLFRLRFMMKITIVYIVPRPFLLQIMQ